MTLEISRAVHDAMLALAADAPAREVCGLLFGKGDRIDNMTPALNVAADPTRHFEIDPAALVAAHRAERGGGPQLVGYFHSHPQGPAIPSATDAALAAPDGRLWIIAGGDDVMAWRATASGFVAVPYKLGD